MWFGGSWDIPFFESEAPEFEWSIFPVPAPEGKEQYVTFHLDAGMGLNAASPNQEAAKVFLDWMSGPQLSAGARRRAPRLLPGARRHPRGRQRARGDIPRLQRAGSRARRPLGMAGPARRDPDGYTLMQSGAVGISNGAMTAQEAADALQAGLAEWFEPAQNCGA